ncbi:protein FAM78A-like [Lepisosteus oculatus]|uniref:protein FAM78A-like n=1 Tax=Lepisosteus oculatus TaxID=7918 RepID=UPI0035F52A4D
MFFMRLLPFLGVLVIFNAIGSSQSFPKRFRESIAVLEVNSIIDSNPTSIYESFSALRYTTPYFRASARVLVPPIAAKETWTVGWIQACNHMQFYNEYGDEGTSSWEIPDLRDGKIQVISDSDGVNYPWYGNKKEIYIFTSPTMKDTEFNVTMDDNFNPSVSWGVPVSNSNQSQLTNIRRDQSFITWLVAINQASREHFILKTIKWRMQLQIEIDPGKPLGQRAKLLEPTAQEQPQILDRNEPIPPNAMVKPNANDAQVLMWRPETGKPVVVIPPKL